MPLLIRIMYLGAFGSADWISAVKLTHIFLTCLKLMPQVAVVQTSLRSVRLSVPPFHGQFLRSAGKRLVPEANSSFRARCDDILCHFPLCRGRNVAATVDALRSAADANETAHDATTSFVISLCASDETSLPRPMRSGPRTMPMKPRTMRSH